MSENPFSSPPIEDTPPDIDTSDSVAGTTAAYNVITDTVTGVNVRGSDNAYQAKFIAVSVLLLAAIGVILSFLFPGWQLDWLAGALMGAFLGLVFGVLGSGIVLMVYRTKRHIKGKHD